MKQETVSVPQDVIDTVIYGDSEDNAIFICQTDWTLDGKYESQSTYFMRDKKYLRYDERRSGSPFSDYNYEDDNKDKENDGNMICFVVGKAEVTLRLMRVEHVVDLLALAEEDDLVYDALPRLM